MKLRQGHSEQDWADWKAKNTDPYGARIMSYAEDWAERMEAFLQQGIGIDQATSVSNEMPVWKYTSHEADTDGITGYMFGAAVATLSLAWLYGDWLKRLHNEDMGQPEAQGVVNPAIMVVGTDG